MAHFSDATLPCHIWVKYVKYLLDVEDRHQLLCSSALLQIFPAEDKKCQEGSEVERQEYYQQSCYQGFAACIAAHSSWPIMETF